MTSNALKSPAVSSSMQRSSSDLLCVMRAVVCGEYRPTNEPQRAPGNRLGARRSSTRATAEAAALERRSSSRSYVCLRGIRERERAWRSRSRCRFSQGRERSRRHERRSLLAGRYRGEALLSRRDSRAAGGGGLSGMSSFSVAFQIRSEREPLGDCRRFTLPPRVTVPNALLLHRYVVTHGQVENAIAVIDAHEHSIRCAGPRGPRSCRSDSERAVD